MYPNLHLLLLHHLLVVAGLALVELVARLALLHLLAGGLRRDVDGADGLAVRVERSAGVLPLVPRPDGLDQQGNLSGGLVVHHLVLLVTRHLQPLACPDDLRCEVVVSSRSEADISCTAAHIWLMRFHFAQYDLILSSKCL